MIGLNNPGNIRDSGIDWKGRTGATKGFVDFDTLHNGIRAIGRNLRTHQLRGEKTIRQLVSAYAPPSENDTEKYIADVCEWTGIAEGEPLDLVADKPKRLALVKAVMRKENGVSYPDPVVQAALADAFEEATPAAAPIPLAKTVSPPAAIFGWVVARLSERSTQVALHTALMAVVVHVTTPGGMDPKGLLFVFVQSFLQAVTADRSPNLAAAGDRVNPPNLQETTS